MEIIVGSDAMKGEIMLRILSLDPSGTGTTGICLINQKITLQEFKSSQWKEHFGFLQKVVKDFQPNLLLYETTNYINSKGKDMTGLLKLMGAIESLPVEKIDSIFVHQVKDLKSKLFKKTKQIPDLTFKFGSGWFYEQKRISLHELDAFLVYHLWKEKND